MIKQLQNFNQVAVGGLHFIGRLKDYDDFNTIKTATPVLCP